MLTFFQQSQTQKVTSCDSLTTAAIGQIARKAASRAIHWVSWRCLAAFLGPGCPIRKPGVLGEESTRSMPAPRNGDGGCQPQSWRTCNGHGAKGAERCKVLRGWQNVKEWVNFSAEVTQNLRKRQPRTGTPSNRSGPAREGCSNIVKGSFSERL